MLPEVERSTAVGNIITKIWSSLGVWFSSYMSGQTDKHTHHTTLHPSQGRSSDATTADVLLLPVSYVPTICRHI